MPKDEYMRVVRERDRLQEQLDGLRMEARQDARDDAEMALRKAYGLQPQEIKVFQALVSATPRALSKGVLFDSVWGIDSDVGIKIVDVRIHYIRSKVGARAVETVWGLGYRITEDGLGAYKKALDRFGAKV